MAESSDVMCSVSVRRGDDWHPRREPCGRKAKGQLANGEPVCGVHLRQEKQGNERRDREAAWKQRIDTVNERLGIRAFGWEIDRAVNIGLDDLEALADRLDP